MKIIIGLLSLAVVNAFASYELFEKVPSDICPEIKIVKVDEFATCKASNSQVVLKAKVAQAVSLEEHKKLFPLYSAVEVGIIPDADSNDAYFYSKWLVNSAGTKVGVKTINGWYNEEMEASGRVDVRYNLKGEVVSIELKPIK